jgi:hypothetical protein
MSTENVSNEEKGNGVLADVMALLPSDDKMEELIRSRSQLFTAYSVKDKEGKFKSVVDIESVVELLREVLGN